jgi:hypothetical protein
MPWSAVYFAEIDWTNAVLIPILTSITVGIPLAIYTGVVTTRLMSFNVAKAEAIQTVMELPVKLRGAGDPYQAEQILRVLFLGIRNRLNADRHYEAADALLIHNEVLERRALKFILDGLNEEEKASIRESRHVGMDMPRWREIMGRDFWGSDQSAFDALIPIHRLRPNYLRTFAIARIPQVAVRSDCGDCCENCNRTL